MYKTQTRINGILIILWFVFLVLKLAKIIIFSWWLVWIPLILVPVLCIVWTIYFGFKDFKAFDKIQFYEQNNY